MRLVSALVVTSSWLVQTDAKPWIAKLGQSREGVGRGSKAGGQKLTIEGDGFSSQKFGLTPNTDHNVGNWVWFRTRDGSQTFHCPLELTGTNTQKIVCITPNFKQLYEYPYDASVNIPIDNPFQSMSVYVVSDGEKSNEMLYSAQNAYTPQIFWAGSQTGYPDREIEFGGAIHTRAYNESMPNWEDSPCCTDRCRAIDFRNGEHLCDIYNEDKSDIRKFLLNNDGRDSRDGNIKCLMGGNQVGYSDISWTVTEAYGKSTVQGNNVIGRDGNPHLIFSYAKISGLSHNVGGKIGGGLITIDGDYFQSDAGDNNVEVMIDGTPCEIVTLTAQEIKCRVPANLKKTNSDKYYPGNHGIIAYTYGQQPDLTLEELEALDLKSPSSVDKATHFHQYWINNDVRYWRYKKEGYSAFAPFFFNPPKDTSYRWSLEYKPPQRWNGNAYDGAAYEDLLQFDRMPNKEEISEPYLIKFKTAEQGDGATAIQHTSWMSRFVLTQYDGNKVYDSKESFKVNQGESQGAIHHYEVEGLFQSEKQKLTLSGDRSLFAGVGAKVGSVETDTVLDFTSDDVIEKVITAISSTQGKSCPAIFTDTNAMYHQNYENTASCMPEVSIQDSFCGKGAAKIFSFGESTYSIFKADESVSTCGQAAISSFKIGRDVEENAHVCLAYKGDGFKEQQNKEKSTMRYKFSYFDAFGDYKVSDWMPLWTHGLDTADATINDWKWKCGMLNKAFTMTDDWANKEDVQKDFGTGQGATGHRLLEIAVFLDKDRDAVAWVDHVTISSVEPLAESENMDLIKDNNLPLIASLNYETIDNDNYIIDMVPGACSTGHEMLGFYGADLKMAKNDGVYKYYKDEWPADTFISVEQTQASKSSLTGTIDLKDLGETTKVLFTKSIILNGKKYHS